jgi:hypothetical protein
MESQKKILNKITSDFINACKRNLEITISNGGEGGIVDRLVEAHLKGNILEIEMLSIQLESIKKEYQNNLISVRQGILTLDLLNKQDFALN